MADFVSQHETACAENTLAKMLAPEDVRIGDFVTVLYVVHEWPAFFWFCESPFEGREEMLRVRLLPEKNGTPLKVRAVCLPFVFVKNAKGKQFALDVRRHQLARLATGYAQKAWKYGKKKRKPKASTAEKTNASS